MLSHERPAGPQGRPPARSGRAAKRSASSEDVLAEASTKDKLLSPFRELDRETLLDEARQAAWLLFILTCLGLLWRILP